MRCRYHRQPLSLLGGRALKHPVKLGSLSASGSAPFRERLPGQGAVVKAFAQVPEGLMLGKVKIAGQPVHESSAVQAIQDRPFDL